MSQATAIPIFKGCISDWTDEQVEFISWCHFYHNVFSATERPDNDIIDDDNKLDTWLKNKNVERRQQEIQSTGGMNSKKASGNEFGFKVMDPNG